ncbi:hypothetical protein Shyhy01_06750 [Streptomyces hygroscopicus subsp. hygroscopicus]|nr:hypothetical protein Shyhy01_06750 [Streptomyces hygroscopicus subsp. hygroscopicus]
MAPGTARPRPADTSAGPRRRRIPTPCTAACLPGGHRAGCGPRPPRSGPVTAESRCARRTAGGRAAAPERRRVVTPGVRAGRSVRAPGSPPPPSTTTADDADGRPEEAGAADSSEIRLRRAEPQMLL